MTKGERRKQQLRLETLIERWLSKLGLQHWDLEILLADEPFPGQPDGFLTVMVVNVAWEYLKAHITVNTPVLQGLSDDRLERCFVHELMHVCLNEIRDRGADELSAKHEERVATELARAFVDLVRDYEARLAACLSTTSSSTPPA